MDRGEWDRRTNEKGLTNSVSCEPYIVSTSVVGTISSERGMLVVVVDGEREGVAGGAVPGSERWCRRAESESERAESKEWAGEIYICIHVYMYIYIPYVVFWPIEEASVRPCGPSSALVANTGGQ